MSTQDPGSVAVGLQSPPSNRPGAAVRPRGSQKLLCLAVGLVCAGSLLLWQALTVRYSYGGNWTALFCTGETYRIPAPLQGENLYIFKGTDGYDGQFYHYLAHDPTLRRGFSAVFDGPRGRARRILIPALASLLALGRDSAVDTAYISTVAIFILLGAYWLARLSLSFGRPAWIGLLFGMVPAVLVSVDRMTVDVALSAFCVGFVLYVREQSAPQLYAILALAPLVRETGILLLAAYGIYLVSQRRLGAAVCFSTAALPVACWEFWLRRHTPPDHGVNFSLVPFYGVAERLVHVTHYAGSRAFRYLAVSLDFLAPAAIMVGVVWAAYLAYRRIWTPAAICAYLFAILALSLAAGDLWEGPYAFGRTLTPLLLLPTLENMGEGWAPPAFAILAIDLGIGLRWSSQVLHVVKGLAG